MFVSDPDPYLLPSYRICPFTTQDIAINHLLAEDSSIDNYFAHRFKGKPFYYTLTGRSAINIALAAYRLLEDDVVTIFTTTENFYISSCVTNEIEKFCKWSRKIEPGTKLIFVNHEFGIPYPSTRELKNYGLPIIEDCCTAFFSADKKKEMGTTGDFVIYSFPKMFPIQIGGLLVANQAVKDISVPVLPPMLLQYIKNVLSHYIVRKENIIQQRIHHYALLRASLKRLGCSERLNAVAGVVPSVYMFTIDRPGVQLPMLKEQLYKHGIQCSVFYGEQAFFIPAHQALSETDIAYFVQVIETFLQNPPNEICQYNTGS